MQNSIYISLVLSVALGVSLFSSSCGVKGPPLPPLVTNPQRSEPVETNIVAEPSPTPTPSIKNKTKAGK